MTKIMDFGELKVGVIEDNHSMGVLGSVENCKLPYHYNCTLLDGGIFCKCSTSTNNFAYFANKT